MNTHVNKTEKKKNQSVANGVYNVQSGGESAFQFVDNRSSEMNRLTVNSKKTKKSAIQRKMIFEKGTEYLDASKNNIPYSAFVKVQEKANFLFKAGNDLVFKEGGTSDGAAKFTPYSNLIPSGEITVDKLTEEAIEEQSYDYHDRLVEASHEVHHAIDNATDLNLKDGAYEERVISEFRTFAVQSALTKQIKNKGKNVSSKYVTWQKSMDPEDKDALLETSNDGFAVGNQIFKTIKTYLSYYSKREFNDTETEQFISSNQGELDYALKLYTDLRDNKKGDHDTVLISETREEEGEEQDLGDGVTISEIKTVTTNSKKPLEAAWNNWAPKYLPLVLTDATSFNSAQQVFLAKYLSHTESNDVYHLPTSLFSGEGTPTLNYSKVSGKYHVTYE